ncbi:YmfQ family protein [Clostridium tagluense]|uniref:YmfQ family protein n=1 Tax=Clostridium tagluense TaxID=360422 RepID=UPI001C6EE0EE|nr:YmfQ family protein [Clostridium tagluense]MBW9154851.1 YmfQ family protein [Clostridium tagluense]WLC64306.1 YmfQ family protein [Clostridium tagluense]
MYGSVEYGTNNYASDVSLEDEQIKPYIPNLMKYLPPYYKPSKIMINIQESNAKEVGRFNYSKKDLLDQSYVGTATWGLSRYEKNLGIVTDLNKSYEERREIIYATKRGTGTATKKMIKNTAEAFSGGEVDVIEDNENYCFTIRFIGVKGIPKNMSAFKDMLDNIKPAHLLYDFKYNCTVWNFLNKFTWNEANKKTWDEIKVYE